MSRTCSECGRQLSFRNEFVVDGRHVCRDCRAKLDPEVETASAREMTPFGRMAPLELRLLGQLIDAAIAYGIIFGVLLFSEAVLQSSLLAMLAVLLGLAYLFLSDGLPNGQSLGKRALKIRVVDEDRGVPCSLGKSLLRNITAFLGIFDWIFIFGKSRQRLGDKFACTIVVRSATGHAVDPAAPSPPDPGDP